MAWVLGRLVALPEDSSQVAEPTCIPVRVALEGTIVPVVYKHTDVQAHDWKKYVNIRSATITLAVICKTSMQHYFLFFHEDYIYNLIFVNFYIMVCVEK